MSTQEDSLGRKILDVVKLVSNEQGISREDIFQAMERAIALATPRHYGVDMEARVAIDRQTGDYKTYRVWHVVDAYTETEDYNPADRELLLPEAQEKKEDAALGGTIEDEIESVAFGRIGVQYIRQMLKEEVRRAKQAKIVESYSDKVNTLMTGLVKKVTRDNVIMDLGNGVEALIHRDELIPREAVRIGDRLRAYLYKVEENARGPQLLMSRTCPEMLIALFSIEVPEIGEEIIEIKGAARDPGVRAKISVKTNDGRIDPVGACVGMRGSRVQTVSNELSGERVDIVLWDADPVQFVINALAPAEIAAIEVDEEKKTMDVVVEESQLSSAIGRNGQNIRLAAELSGWQLNVMSNDEAGEKKEQEKIKLCELFMEKLDIDEEVADVLIQEGFSSLEEVAYVAEEEMQAVEAFDEETAIALQERAKDALLSVAMGAAKPDASLLEVEGITEALAADMAENGIITMEDLAEQSVDELMEIKGMDEEMAAALIMAARKPWFAPDEDVSSSSSTKA